MLEPSEMRTGGIKIELVSFLGQICGGEGRSYCRIDESKNVVLLNYAHQK